jgi:hypothetical protein
MYSSTFCSVACRSSNHTLSCAPNTLSMKSFLLTVGLSLTGIIVHSQTYKDSISRQFLRFTDLITAKQFEASTEYVNPEIFKIITKQQMVMAMEKTMNNPEIDIKVGPPTITSIGDSVSINKMTYVKIRYSGNLAMRFSEESGIGTDTAATIQALEGQFGKGKVTFNKATGFYNVATLKEVVANSNDHLHWTFTVVEERQKHVLEKFLPKELGLFE